MEKETITDNLEKLLMAIHRQVVVIRDAEHQVPKIEMDKTLSNIRALYEQFTVLNYLNTYPAEKKSAVEITPSVEAKAQPEKQDSPFVPIVEKHTEPIEQPADGPVLSSREPAMSAAIRSDSPEQVVTVPKKEEPVIPKQPDPEPVKPIIEAQASHDKNAWTEPQRLGDRLRTQKIDDLYKAISLSDKFLYMNELFEAENNAYREAIDMLNRLTSYDEAVRYMDGLAARYKWQEHARTEKKFRDVVSRKFV